MATADMSSDLANPSTLRIWNVSGLPTDGSRSRETSDGPAKTELSQVRLLAIVPLRTWGHSVAWSPDGKQIACGGKMGMCEILDLATGQTRSLAWHKESQLLAITPRGGGLPVVLDTTSGEVIARGPAHIAAFDIAWSPDGTELVVHERDSSALRFLDGKTDKLLRSGPERGQNYVTIHPTTLLLSPNGNEFHVKFGLERSVFETESAQLLERRKAASNR